eukprot:TRINITY_DN6744_c0_g1_i1.p1 TRINITY_DN6744_c0_g1~~TRINITY_DN6744_c0_g1_i1.p1  ORF type:complete len:376 (+),score=77.56 TRINITY_DN6744_c0_g1_i1:288-1415(+)
MHLGNTLNEEIDDDPLNATVICTTEDDMDVENVVGDKSPTLNRIATRFNSSFNLGSNINNTSDSSFALDPPPTPTYDNRNSYIQTLRLTPPSPSSLPLKDITNHHHIDFPSRLRKNLVSKSNSHPQLPARRLYHDDDYILSDSAPCSPLKKRAITQSTSSLPVATNLDDFSCFKPQSYEMMPPPNPIHAEAEEDIPLVLPTIHNVDDFRRIDGDTVERLLSGEFDHMLERYIIMDCRYDYEYEGGHIQGAIRMSPELIFDYEMPEPIRKGDNRLPTVIIMHCEFSSVRAPTCIRSLKQKDRHTNHMRGYAWPLCSYPNVYLLDGGYKRFFECKKHLCEPQAYVPETHKQHTVKRAQRRSERKSQLLLQKSNSFKL